MLEALRREPHTHELNLKARVAEVAVQRGYLPDGRSGYCHQLPRELWRRFRDVLWGLIVEGVVAVGIDSNNTAWPFLSVTEYGEACLAAGEVVPHDPDGYLNALEAVRPLDDVEKRFIPQALHAYLRNLPDASAVMLGCASEHLLQVLADAVVTVEPQRKQKIEHDRQKASRLINGLNGWLAQRQIPDDLEEERVHTFDGLAQMIRITRNDAGHPRGGRPVARDRVYALLQLFLGYRTWIARLLTYLGQ
jgi:hypothetical protein